MKTFRKPLLIVLGVAAALAGLVFTAAFVMVFLGDPEFPAALKMTPEDMAAFAARFEQPYPAVKRKFTMRDGTVLASQYFPALSSGKSSTTVVLIHGVLSSSFPLNRTSGLLREAASAEVVAIDLRGHGASGGVPGDVDYIGQYEDDVADVIAKIRAATPGGRIILAGHSMGGGIALRYAMRDGVPPVDGYLLFAPHLGPKSPTNRWEKSETGEAFLQVHIPRILGLALFNSVGFTGFNGLRTLFFNLPKEMPLRSYSYRAMTGSTPTDHGPALKAVDKPLLVVVSSKDEAFKADQFEAAIRPYSTGEVVIVEGASHDGVLNEPRTLAAVTRWISRL
ncbi:MAG TPA: alpha/beta hydrolase [Thermoanaerobaculia bacterium]|nr:alpha/beta hydrolase [Thermoanaerobaculia bacterium]